MAKTTAAATAAGEAGAEAPKKDGTAKAGGAGAIGAAAVVLLAHGSDYESAEVTMLTAGAAALVIWLGHMVERLIAWRIQCRAEAAAACGSVEDGETAAPLRGVRRPKRTVPPSPPASAGGPKPSNE